MLSRSAFNTTTQSPEGRDIPSGERRVLPVYKEDDMTLVEMKKYKRRCFVRVFSGTDVDLLTPQPKNILLQDIAYHLSKIERYNGACKFSVTVGLHSLMVADILPAELKPYGLLHDASEAYLGDVVGPLKDLLPGYQEIEGNLMRVILEKYGLRFPMPPEVKEADKAVLAAEMRQANGWHDLAQEIGHAAPVILYNLPQYVVFERLLSAFRKFFPDTE
jgi:hypothetical protein